MTLQLESAVSTLARGAQAREADAILERRLEQVQEFLARDLFEVERALDRQISDGPELGVAAARHLVGRGGKRVRPLSLLLAGRCFGGAGANYVEMAAVVELVHSATLLHDDVVDDGMERRGAITARRRFGNGVSVLSGDLLLVHALERTKEAAPSLLPELITTLRRLVDGEIVQLRGRTELDASEATYERILLDKTASLFAFATQAGAKMAGAPVHAVEALASFGEALGFAFQLVDDVIDYSGEQSGKLLFADLTEGKMTLPLVLAIEKDPQLRELVARIHQGDRDLVAEVSRRVLNSGTCEEVRERARHYTRRALASLDDLPASPARELMRIVAEEMTGRAL